MRILKLNLLAVMLLLFSMGSANAWRVDMVSNYNGVDILAPSDTVSITVMFDSEGATGLMLLAFGLQFDDAVLAYNPGASSTPTYLMYTTSKNAYLQPASTCSPVCNIFPLPPANQVQLDFLSSKVSTNVAIPSATVGAESLGTYVFHVINPGDGLGEIDFLFSLARGSILQLGNTTQPPLALGSGVHVITPEPTTAVLIGLGLAGLGVAGRRRD